MEFSERTPAFGSKTPTVVIMAGKIPASDFVAFVDAVEQRRAMEEYGNEDLGDPCNQLARDFTAPCTPVAARDMASSGGTISSRTFLRISAT